MLPVIGFSEEQTRIIHEILADADTALKNCVSNCDPVSSKFKEEFRYWFSEESDDNEPSVKLLIWTVKQMRDRLEEPGGRLVVSCCDKPHIMNGDYGNVKNLPHLLERTEERPGKPVRAAVNVRETIDSYYQAGNKGKIRLASKVLDLDRYSRYGVSQLLVFLHELSHWAAGTRDLKETSKADTPEGTIPQRCYGTSTGVVSAVMRGKYPDGTMRAVQNADTVGFFVTSFFT